MYRKKGKNKYTRFAEINTALYFELLALSRMTGEQILNELKDNERKEYEKYMG
jgi:hypothetical protein